MSKPLKHTLRILLAIVLALRAACGEGGDRAAKRAEVFDAVWNHLNENFYDADFRGRDWEALGRRYRPLALAAPTEEEFYGELNGMLFELGVSHIALLPDDHPEWIGAPTAFARGEIGLDLRIIDGVMVIVSRKAALGRQAPELQPGTVLTRLNGRTLDDFYSEVREPPVSALPELMLVTERAQRALYAEPGTQVTVAWLDEAGQERTSRVTAFERGSAITLLEGVPPVYVDFESRLLDGNIGYIRFNSFHPALLERILTAIGQHSERPGLIIDLRGNVGGDFQVRRRIAEHLLREPSRVWRYSGRRGVDDVMLEPAAGAYDGEVVFLIDELSASSAEELSGAMQALGRALVVGTPSAGLVLVADVLRLDIGASLIFPVAQTSFVNGYIPEGKGIQPDVLVNRDRVSLIQGRDVQLEAALGQLRVAVAEDTQSASPVPVTRATSSVRLPTPSFRNSLWL